MNLTNFPNREQLKTILAQCNDQTADHICWVDKTGEVQFSPLPSHLTPNGFELANKDTMKFRLETFVQNNGYVGKKAAADEQWVERLYKALTKLWQDDFTGYYDDV